MMNRQTKGWIEETHIGTVVFMKLKTGKNLFQNVYVQKKFTF